MGLSINDVLDIVDKEGLGYAVQDYLDKEEIDDDELYDLWEEAERALNALDRYLTLKDTRE